MEGAITNRNKHFRLHRSIVIIILLFICLSLVCMVVIESNRKREPLNVNDNDNNNDDKEEEEGEKFVSFYSSNSYLSENVEYKKIQVPRKSEKTKR